MYKKLSLLGPEDLILVGNSIDIYVQDQAEHLEKSLPGLYRGFGIFVSLRKRRFILLILINLLKDNEKVRWRVEGPFTAKEIEINEDSTMLDSTFSAL